MSYGPWFIVIDRNGAAYAGFDTERDAADCCHFFAGQFDAAYGPHRVVEVIPADALAAAEARAAERDEQVVARLRESVHQAEAQDVGVFEKQSSAELVASLRDTMPWMPTALHALVHAAAARLAACEKDKERLDWLAANINELGFAAEGGKYGVYRDDAAGVAMDFEAPTFRAAIDAARAEENDG